MIALLQRVAQARVEIGGQAVGAIGAGLLMLVCAEPEDTPAVASKMVDKVLKLRIFGDDQGRMNRSVQDTAGGLLIVSQFTLAADTRGGNRPSFTAAAPPASASAVGGLAAWLSNAIKTPLTQSGKGIGRCTSRSTCTLTISTVARKSSEPSSVRP